MSTPTACACSSPGRPERGQQAFRAFLGLVQGQHGGEDGPQPVAPRGRAGPDGPLPTFPHDPQVLVHGGPAPPQRLVEWGVPVQRTPLGVENVAQDGLGHHARLHLSPRQFLEAPVSELHPSGPRVRNEHPHRLLLQDRLVACTLGGLPFEQRLPLGLGTFQGGPSGEVQHKGQVPGALLLVQPGRPHQHGHPAPVAHQILLLEGAGDARAPHVLLGLFAQRVQFRRGQVTPAQAPGLEVVPGVAQHVQEGSVRPDDLTLHHPQDADDVRLRDPAELPLATR